jgi:hypothetical protein
VIVLAWPTTYQYPLIQRWMEHAPSVGLIFQFVESSGLSFGRRLVWCFVVGRSPCRISLWSFLFSILHVLLHINTTWSLDDLSFFTMTKRVSAHDGIVAPLLRELWALFFISDDNDASIQADDSSLLLLPGSREDLSLSRSSNEAAVDKGESKRAREYLSIGSQEAAVDNGQSTRGRKDLSVGLQEAAVDKGKSARGRTSLCVASVFVIHLWNVCYRAFQFKLRMLPWKLSGWWLVFLSKPPLRKPTGPNWLTRSRRSLTESFIGTLALSLSPAWTTQSPFARLDQNRVSNVSTLARTVAYCLNITHDLICKCWRNDCRGFYFLLLGKQLRIRC